jgi:aryl carrier-like protein
VGLARGYLNREELTKEKFIDNPYKPGERIYRTGDLGRWNEDQNLEYLGRIDDQVKIRGYRIELGEIESVLSQHEQVTAVVVVAKAISGEEKELIAYTTGEAEASDLKSYLKEKLPSYMVPSYYVKLDSIPLTSNGKVNRKALPMPEGTGISTNNYIAPSTAIEKSLVKIWSEVLRAKEQTIGVQTDFFDLGGDSIKSIQVVARMRNAGYELRISDVMGSSMLGDMALKVKPLTRKISQEVIEGEVLFSPVQLAFLGNDFASGTKDKKHYFNQSFLLEFKGGLTAEESHVILKNITEHHDALRMVYSQDEQGKWCQNNKGLSSTKYELRVFDLHRESPELISEKIQNSSEAIKSSMDIEKGPLVKAGLFQLSDSSQFLLTIHHLVIDLVSWRILFEDIQTILSQYRKGKSIQLPEKTDSFQYWMHKNKAYATSSMLEEQRIYWEGILQTKTDTIPVFNTAGENTYSVSKPLYFSLSQEETTKLQGILTNKNKLDINTILLLALGQGLRDVFGTSSIKVNLEGHGREEYIDQVDISRTIGWFTSMFPIVLPTQEESISLRGVVSFNDSLKCIPDKGVGYGILKYLT